MKIFMDVPTSAGTGNAITVGSTTTSLRVTDLTQSPYYVGQKVYVLATGTGTAPPANITGTNGVAVISTINWERPDSSTPLDQTKSGKLTLTFENDWGVALTADKGYDNVSVQIAPCTPTLRVNEAELVLKRLDETEIKGYDEINYTTFSCEEGNGNGATSFQDLFTIEPSANQAIMMFANGVDELISSSIITNFRCALNNIDVTDRQVDVKSPLYYDRLSQSLRGMGYKLNDTLLNGGVSTNIAWSGVFNKAIANISPVVASLFPTDSNKFLQIRADCAGGIQKYQLFKSLPRTFSY